jgi:peptidyl-tRNA hydrolase, PTH1 family
MGVDDLFCTVGLGNPGTQYEQTRHNAGFLVIDIIAGRFGFQVNKKDFDSFYGKGTIEGKNLFLVKPQTYMNRSGQAVYSIVDYFKIPLDRVLIIYDDLDLPLGTIRLRLSGSAGGHKGLGSVINQLGTSAVARLRIGIGKPDPEMEVPDYVLTRFTGPQQLLFKETLERAAEAAVCFVTRGPDYAMNHFNTSNPAREELKESEARSQNPE